MRARMSRRFFHYFCVILLLLAQQGALVHATWHAGEDAHAHAHEGHAQEQAGDHESSAGGSQRNLCAFDLAFGQVLGGVHGACALPLAVELPAAIASYTFNPRLGCEAVPAHSRGPPQHL